MKGKLLTLDEILKMDGKYVYLKPPYDSKSRNEGKAKIELDENKIWVYPINGEDSPWVAHIEDLKTNSFCWVKLYE